jgi:hypothetical protein
MPEQCRHLNLSCPECLLLGDVSRLARWSHPCPGGADLQGISEDGWLTTATYSQPSDPAKSRVSRDR